MADDVASGIMCCPDGPFQCLRTSPAHSVDSPGILAKRPAVHTVPTSSGYQQEVFAFVETFQHERGSLDHTMHRRLRLHKWDAHALRQSYVKLVEERPATRQHHATGRDFTRHRRRQVLDRPQYE